MHLLQIMTIKKDQSGYRNFAYVAGQGEGKDRTIETVYEGSAEPTGYSRRELFVDARDVENDGELPDRGAQKLSETTKAVGIKVKFNNNGAFSIDEDFQCGDFVTAKSERSTDDAQVVKVSYQYDGSTGYPTIDLVLDFDPDDIERVISTRLNQYDALLSKETDTNLLVPKGLQVSSGYCVVPMTDGYYSYSSSITGYIKITLPVNQRHMISMVVDVFNYSPAGSAQFILSGFTDTTDGRWENCCATQLGQIANADMPIYFGIDSSGNYSIWIGTSTTLYYYPSVRVRDVKVNFGTIDINDYTTGWDVSIVSSMGITADVACNRWITPTLTDGWSNYQATSHYDVAFRRINNQVFLRGLVAGGSVGTSYKIFTLPEGYRPNHTVMCTTMASSELARCDVYTDGRVVANFGSNGWFNLTGISFFVD